MQCTKNDGYNRTRLQTNEEENTQEKKTLGKKVDLMSHLYGINAVSSFPPPELSSYGRPVEH